MAESRPRLVVRALRKTDLKAVQEIQKKSFPTIDAWTKEQFESQLNIFPEGQLGVELDGVLVATSSSLIVDEEDFGAYHTFDQVSDKGFIRNHDPEGDTLFDGITHIIWHLLAGVFYLLVSIALVVKAKRDEAKTTGGG